MGQGSKRKYFEVLIEKMEAALQNEFYFETVWLAYSLIEGRVDSALDKTGGKLPERTSFGIKLRTLRGRIPLNNHLLQLPHYAILLTRISAWKDRRNDLMHALPESVQSREDLETDCKAIAYEGHALAKEMLNRGKQLRALVAADKGKIQQSP